MDQQEFSARKCGPKNYRNRFRTILGKVAQGGRKSTKWTLQKSEIWVVLGRHGSVWAGNGSVWIQIGIETYWNPFGPHLGHLWTSFGPFSCFWTIAGLLLAISLLFPIPPFGSTPLFGFPKSVSCMAHLVKAFREGAW